MMNAESYKYKKFYAEMGETRWADVEEIRAVCDRVSLTRLPYPSAGIPIMNNGTEAWVDGSDTHSLIFGSTGSKKTRLFVMPMINLMAGAGESFIVTDPKGELYDRTSATAEKLGYKVRVLNYRDLAFGDTWNPLALPYELYQNGLKDDAVARLDDFVQAISGDVAKNTKDPFWVNAARSVALACLMMMMEVCRPEEVNLRTFTRLCQGLAAGTTDTAYLRAAGADPDGFEKNYLTELMRLAPADSIARLNYDGIASSSDRARGDVQSMLSTLIQVFITQDKLVRNMARNTFDMRTFGREPTAVYLIVPDEKTTFHFIATTFVKQCYETLILEAQREPNRQLPLRVNFVLDEFANIPAIPDMPAMITAARSRNMRFYLVIQSMHQLLMRYGEEAQTIKGNCDNWVFLTSKEYPLLKEISALCGNIALADGSRTRPLISVSQLQRLNKQRGEALIFNGRQYPMITEMADIDDCAFEKLPPMAMTPVPERDVESVDAETLYKAITGGRRRHPFAGPRQERGLLGMGKKGKRRRFSEENE